MNEIRKILNIILKLLIAYGLTVGIDYLDGVVADFAWRGYGKLGGDNAETFVFIAIYTTMIWIPFKNNK